MVAFRSDAVAFLLILIQVETMARWSSTDMSRKDSADKQTQGQKASELRDVQSVSGHIDSLLDGNISKLGITKGELRQGKAEQVDLAKQIKDTTGKLQQAKKAFADKKNALEESTKKATETADALLHAQTALSEAQDKVTDWKALEYVASSKEAKAEYHLAQMVINNQSDKVQAAKDDLGLKQEVLAHSSEALQEAEKQAAAKQTALKLADTAAGTAEAEQANATQAYQDAVGAVGSVGKYLSELYEKAVRYAKVIGALGDAVQKEEIIVNVLHDQSQALHEEVHVKRKAYDEISAVVDTDAACVSSMRRHEGNLESTTRQFKQSADEYEAAPAAAKKDLLGALWTLRDQKDSDANALYSILKDCAPKTVKLGPEPSLPPCSNSTGVICWLWCKGSRHATCSSDYRCACPAGTCARDGECVGRGSPVLAASPPTERRAEPEAAGAVFLAAAALTMMIPAFLVPRMRRAPEVRMPESFG